MASGVSSPERAGEGRDAFGDLGLGITSHHPHRRFLGTQISLLNMGEGMGEEGPLGSPCRMPRTGVP